MIERDEHTRTAAQLDSTLVEFVDEISDPLQACEGVDTTDFVQRYPQRADAILNLLTTMQDLVDYGRAVNCDRRHQERQPV